MRLTNWKVKDSIKSLHIRFPNMTFWGILTIIGILSNSQGMVDITSTIFLFTAIFSLRSTSSGKGG